MIIIKNKHIIKKNETRKSTDSMATDVIRASWGTQYRRAYELRKLWMRYRYLHWNNSKGKGCPHNSMKKDVVLSILTSIIGFGAAPVSTNRRLRDVTGIL